MGKYEGCPRCEKLLLYNLLHQTWIGHRHESARVCLPCGEEYNFRAKRDGELPDLHAFLAECAASAEETEPDLDLVGDLPDYIEIDDDEGDRG